MIPYAYGIELGFGRWKMSKADSENNNEIIRFEITVESLQSKIYTIRGQRVMLASDLAEIYGYTTRAFNQQVRRNIERFPKDFMFELTIEEAESISRSQNVTLNDKKVERGSNIKYAPMVFTESGIYMLMTVLKGELAISQSKILIRTFKQMKDYIQTTQILSVPQEIVQLSFQVSENTKEISDIKEKMLTKDDLTKIIQSFSLPEKGIEYVIYSGKTFEADSAYADIYSKAKRKIFIVDNYIGPKTLLMLKSVPANVDIIVFSDNIRNMLRLSELQSFQNEYPNVRLSFQKTGGKFHDRYIVIDYKTQSEKIYHCGASSKDAGNKITTISKSDNKELYHPMVDDLLLQPVLQLR